MMVQTPFSSTWIYARHHLLMFCSQQPILHTENRTGVRIVGVANLGIILVVVPVKRIRRIILASTSAAFAHKITPCFRVKETLKSSKEVTFSTPTSRPELTAPNEEILFLQHFDTVFHCHTPLPSMRPRTYQWTMIYRTLPQTRKLLLTVLFIPRPQARTHLL